MRAYVLWRDRWTCMMRRPDGYSCGAYATTVDHITPRSRGGSDHPSNLRAACATCNYRRGAKPDTGRAAPSFNW